MLKKQHPKLSVSSDIVYLPVYIELQCLSYFDSLQIAGPEITEALPVVFLFMPIEGFNQQFPLSKLRVKNLHSEFL